MCNRRDEAGRFRRRPRRDQETITLKVIGFDAWIEGRPHETAPPRVIQPEVLVAGERGAKVLLRNAIEPRCLQQRPGPTVAGFHHQLDQWAQVRCGITNLRRPGEPAPRVGPDEIINDLECQVCTRQGLVRKIHVTLKKEWKNPAPGGRAF